jgi:hypothetical protein
MGKLDNLGPFRIDDADEVGADRKDSFLCIIAQSPVRVKLRKLSFIETNRKNIRKLLHAKWPN